MTKLSRIGVRLVAVYLIPVKYVNTGTQLVEVDKPHWACGKLDCNCDRDYDEMVDLQMAEDRDRGYV